MKKKIKLEDIRPDNELYEVEETYFDELSNRISNSVQQQNSTSSQTIFGQIWGWKTIKYGTLTAFLVIFGVLLGYYLQPSKNNQVSQNQLFVEVPSEALTSYLMQEELEDEFLIPYYAGSSTEMYSDFSEISAETLQEQVIDLEDYF